jgi:hypothetical protein
MPSNRISKARLDRAIAEVKKFLSTAKEPQNIAKIQIACGISFYEWEDARKALSKNICRHKNTYAWIEDETPQVSEQSLE